jgi:hypothetical protein
MFFEFYKDLSQMCKVLAYKKMTKRNFFKNNMP